MSGETSLPAQDTMLPLAHCSSVLVSSLPHTTESAPTRDAGLSTIHCGSAPALSSTCRDLLLHAPILVLPAVFNVLV